MFVQQPLCQDVLFITALKHLELLFCITDTMLWKKKIKENKKLPPSQQVTERRDGYRERKVSKVTQLFFPTKTFLNFPKKIYVISQDNKFRRAEMRWWRISKKEQHNTCSTSSTWPVLRQPSLYSDANSHGQVGSKGKLLFQVKQPLFFIPDKNMEISIQSCTMIKLLINKTPKQNKNKKNNTKTHTDFWKI